MGPGQRRQRPRQPAIDTEGFPLTVSVLSTASGVSCPLAIFMVRLGGVFGGGKRPGL